MIRLGQLFLATILAQFVLSAQTQPIAILPTTLPLASAPRIAWLGGTGFIAVGFQDSLRLGSVALRSRGLSDVALVAISSNGSVLWWQHIGGPADDSVTALQASTHGVTLAIAAGGGTAGHSTITVGTTTFDTRGGYDVALARFTHSGNLAWARVDGASYADIPTGMIVTEDGSVCLATTIVRQSTFGSFQITDNGESTVALVWYSAEGAVQYVSSGNAANASSSLRSTSSVWLRGTDVELLVLGLGDTFWHNEELSSADVTPWILRLSPLSSQPTVIGRAPECQPEEVRCTGTSDGVVTLSLESVPCQADVLPSLMARLQGSPPVTIGKFDTQGKPPAISAFRAAPGGIVIAGTAFAPLRSADGADINAGPLATGLLMQLGSMWQVTLLVASEGLTVTDATLVNEATVYSTGIAAGVVALGSTVAGAEGLRQLFIARHGIATGISETHTTPSSTTSIGIPAEGGPWAVYALNGALVAPRADRSVSLSSGLYVFSAPYQPPFLVIMP